MSNLLLERSAQMGRHSLLPKEYQQVEYIESTGTQWIDTGYYPTGYTKIEIGFQMLNQGSQQQGIFGARPEQHSFFSLFSGAGANKLQADYNTSGNLAWYLSAVGSLNLNEYTNIQMSNLLFVNGNIAKSLPLSDFHSNRTLFIFANNNRGAAQLPASMKLFSFLWYESDVLVHSLIPCLKKSNHAPGLFDICQNSFLPNSGTGSFVIGPPKQ